MQSEDGRIFLKFSQEAPGNLWTPIKLLRESDKSFDFRLRQQFTLLKNGVDNDINSVWKAFQTIFNSVKPLVTYRPVFKDYFYQVSCLDFDYANLLLYQLIGFERALRR